MIKVDRLTFSYTKKPFIQDMGFSVSEGEIFGFLGLLVQERVRCRRFFWGCFQTIRDPLL